MYNFNDYEKHMKGKYIFTVIIEFNNGKKQRFQNIEHIDDITPYTRIITFTFMDRSKMSHWRDDIKRIEIVW